MNIDETRINRLAHNVAMIKSLDIANLTRIAYTKATEAMDVDEDHPDEEKRSILEESFRAVHARAEDHLVNRIHIPQTAIGLDQGRLIRVIPFYLPLDGLQHIPYILLKSADKAGTSAPRRQTEIPNSASSSRTAGRRDSQQRQESQHVVGSFDAGNAAEEEWANADQGDMELGMFPSRSVGGWELNLKQ
jgi:hypothetical protein